MKTPADLVEEMLRLIRRDFYGKVPAKQFFQERPKLLKAIYYPAAYLEEKGATNLSIGRYRTILQTVINAIKEHGGKIGRFEVYFLWCVQQHMAHHGDEYYEEAKAPRAIGSLVAGVLQKAHVAAGLDRTVEVLAEAHRALATRGRIRKTKKVAHEQDLFSSCTPLASAMQKR